ncbi:hypothetical protein [Mycolicibacterium mengxianglii]|uniref:hypothetical protein n=1 Tax=Mycolicibacterium mengxianglii TaxID=2736649 RepID=UPI001E604ACA|nr:hypothetical protein [Mycolicibacterium mengxianglii]
MDNSPLMGNSMRRCVGALGIAATVVGAPMALATVMAPPSWACPVGQVASGGACTPYCPDGALLDAQTGSCVQPAAAPEPPAPPPPPAPPAWNGDITPYFAVCAGIPTPIPFVGFNACI